MTLFDIIVLAILLLSAGAGWFRGAVREMVTMFAFGAAALLAIFSLRYTTPVARGLIADAPDWVASVVAVVVVFLVAYVGVRLLGGGLSKRLHQTQALGVLDRTIGLAFGLIRALIVVGAFHLAFTAATPPERMPRWMTGAALYPLTEEAGRVLKAVAPKGLDMAGRLKPALTDAVSDGSGDATPAEDGYEARARRGLDDLVEKTR